MTHERNETEAKKPWYKTVLGILFIIFTFPLTLPPVLLYVIWVKSKQDQIVKIILTALIAIVTLVIWIPALSDNQTQTDSNALRQTPTDSVTESTSQEKAENIDESELQPTPEPSPKQKEWVNVFEVTANSSKQSETFHLNGGQQKIIYKTVGDDYTMCAIYVMDEGTSLDENGGFPVVMIDGSQEDETMMRKSAGDYYMDLSIANGSCIVELQEYR